MMRGFTRRLLLALLLSAVCAGGSTASETPAVAPTKALAPSAQTPQPTVQELAQTLTTRYQKRTPREWRERGPGIVSVLPPSLHCGIDQGQTSGQSPDKTPGQTPQRGVAITQTPPRGVAITLDACEGKTDMRIIALLREHKISAAIFVTNSWLRRNASIAADLAADPLFTLEAHGTRHKPASVAGWSAFGIPGTGNVAALVDEVETNARAITALAGKRPRWFRSGTAFYDDVALLVIRDLGFSVAGFAVSADQGATLPFKTVAKRLISAKDGDIVLLHLNHPESGTYDGMKEALPKMIQAGVQFVGL